MRPPHNGPHSPEQHYLTQDEWRDIVGAVETVTKRVETIEYEGRVEKALKDFKGKGWGWIGNVVTAILTALLTAGALHYFGK